MESNWRREYFKEHPQENMSWCKPYTANDDKASWVINEGTVCGVRIKGHDMRHDWSEEELNRFFPDNHEAGCVSCPYFNGCDAMDDY